jgi:hypothetical protein
VFIRKKTVNGQVYYYLVRSGRRGDRVKQEMLCYMGQTPTVKEALATWPEQIRRHVEAEAKCRAEAEGLAKSWPKHGGRVLRPDLRKHRYWENAPIRRYWLAMENAEHHRRLAAERSGQLDKLRAALAAAAAMERQTG